MASEEKYRKVGMSMGEAASASMTQLVTSLGTGIESIGGQMMTAIGSIVPKALPVMGALMVISISIGLFRSIAHK